MDFNFENKDQWIKDFIDQYQKDNPSLEAKNNIYHPLSKLFSDKKSITYQEYIEYLQNNITTIDYQLHSLQQQYQQNLKFIQDAIIYSANIKNWNINGGISKYLDSVLSGNYNILVENDHIRETVQKVCLENQKLLIQIENLYFSKLEYQENKKKVEQSTPNIHLDNEILMNMPKDLTEEEICRYIYLALARKTVYDSEYILTKNPDIYNKKVQIHTLESNKVICSDWSELYRQLLILAGIDKNKIHIMGHAQNYEHRYVEIDFDNYKVIADATGMYSGITDLIATKIGMNTTGFVKAPHHLKLDDYKKRKEYIYDQTSKNIKWLDNLDIKADIERKQNIYDEVSRTFQTSHLYLKTFGSNCDKNIGIKMQKIHEKLKKLDSFESYGYLLYMKKILFTEEEAKKIKIALLSRLNHKTKNHDVVSCISIQNSDNTTHYYLSSANQGFIEVSKEDILASGYQQKLGEDISLENLIGMKGPKFNK